MELILIRHATTMGNIEKRFIGRTDIPISDEGICLAKSVHLPDVSHVYVSPLLRCRQSADIYWPDIEKTTVPDLTEMNFGIFEGKNHRELQGNPDYEKWLSNPLDSDLVESSSAVARRMKSALNRICCDMNTNGFSKAAIVSHGGALACMLSALGKPQRDFYDWLLPNCGGYTAKVTADPLTLNIIGQF